MYTKLDSNSLLELTYSIPENSEFCQGVKHCFPCPLRSCSADLWKSCRGAFIPFIMAGDPDLETTGKALLALDEVGADVIELGVPYSVRHWSPLMMMFKQWQSQHLQ